MRTNAPAPSRVTIEHVGGEVRAIIRVRRSWPVALVLSVWLCIWASGEVSTANDLLAGWRAGKLSLFYSCWLAGWTLGGLLALRTLVWALAGREEIALGSRVLAHRWASGPFRRAREYDLASIRDLRADTELVGASATTVMTPSAGRRVRGETPGRTGMVLFEHAGSTVRVGSDLEGEDLEKVLAMIRARVPSSG
jgi:hypothetical protein